MDPESPELKEWIETCYAELHEMARRQLNYRSTAVTLSPTTLVHEMFLKLSKQRNVDFREKCHFLAVAATQMRRVLVDHARSKNRVKRGGCFIRIDYDDETTLSPQSDTDVLALDDALTQLANLDPMQAQIIEMRFFGGMTVSEAAEALGVSSRKVELEWRLSRDWLRKTLQGQ